MTKKRERLFGEIVDDEMVLNELGKIVAEEWLKTAELRENVELSKDEFVVMPNHFHGIIHLYNSENVKRDTKVDFCKGTARRAPTGYQPEVEQFGKPVSGSIPTIMRAFKSAVTRRINIVRNTEGNPVWQRNYYDHIIGTDKEFEQIEEYILDNPLKWAWDEENQALE